MTPLQILALLIGSLAFACAAAADHPAPVPTDAGEPVLEWSRFEALDRSKLAVEDEAEARKGNPGGFRFAQPEPVDIVPGRDGPWTRAPDGAWLWRHGVSSPDAVHLNFGFSRFRLPSGASLRIASADGGASLRAYTADDNDAHGELWTPILRSREAVLELRVPGGSIAALELRLSHVGLGYRGFRGDENVCKSGACNMDVACLAPDDPWQGPRHAVGTYSFGGNRICTGSLLNNTRQDRRMLFVTATHCGVSPGNAPSVVVYWNFEAPTCRAPGSAESALRFLGSLEQNQTGATFLAATRNPYAETGGEPETRSDVALLELDDPPAPELRLHFAGWDRGVAAASCAAPAEAASTTGLCATVHHPRGDEKRITFSEQPPVVADLVDEGSVGAIQVHWQASWDPTPPVLPLIVPTPKSVPAAATEPGSSGSPFYNDLQRMVGVLSGGPSFCGATGAELSDFYGQLAHAWEGLATPDTRVRDYLDPDDSGATILDGMDLFPLLADSFEDP